MSLCNHCNNVCDNDVSYVSCKRCKLNYHYIIHYNYHYYYNCLSKANILPSTFSKNTTPNYIQQIFTSANFPFFVHNVYLMYYIMSM